MAGKILRVDLTGGTITEEDVSEELQKRFIGGAGINAKLLYDALKDKPDADPLGPDNTLIFGPGLSLLFPDDDYCQKSVDRDIRRFKRRRIFPRAAQAGRL